MADQRWEHFEHGADIGVRGRAPDKASAFAGAALAMTAAITDPAGVRPVEPVSIECAAPDDELLLVDWLNALIFEMAVRRMLFGRFDVAIEDGRLSATAWGEPVEVERHRPIVEIKGATLTAASVSCRDGEWIAQCVIDV